MRKLADLIFQRDRLREELSKIEKEISVLTQKTPSLNLPFAHEIPKDTDQEKPSDSAPLTPQQKISLFYDLFKGRGDTFAERWESFYDPQKAGYSPICIKRSGECRRPYSLCKNCPDKRYKPFTPKDVEQHLLGNKTVGTYPLVNGRYCPFAVIDLDEDDWRNDAKAILECAEKLGIPAYPEISRSGKGIHIWIFFEGLVSAKDARLLCDSLITLTQNQIRTEVSLSSFDRIIPCQDVLGTNQLGNLVALPLQKKRRPNASVFVDKSLQPIKDQWQLLRTVRKLSAEELSEWLENYGVDESGNVTAENDLPWESAKFHPKLKAAAENITVDVFDKIYFRLSDLTVGLKNALTKFVTFHNPMFYQLQALNKFVGRTPRFLTMAEPFNRDYFSLPRGVLTEVKDLLEENDISFDLRDRRVAGTKVFIKLDLKLREKQKKALKALLSEDQGLLIASTGFGKTIVAAALIAERKVSTLILVNRVELVRQWQTRLQTLNVGSAEVGVWYGTKRKRTEEIDVASIQSVERMDEEELRQFLSSYGMLIVDECHHVASPNYQRVVSCSAAKYRYGLSATPARKDGKEKIINFLCGPKLMRVEENLSAKCTYRVLEFDGLFYPFTENTTYAQLASMLADNEERSRRVIEETVSLYHEGRKVLLLTERVAHQNKLEEMLTNESVLFFNFHARLKEKEREEILLKISKLPANEPFILLANGKLIGEGFDLEKLDTVIFSFPFSWKAVVTQYIGRVMRRSPSKKHILLIDTVDRGNPILERMFRKRQKVYEALGFKPQDVQADLFVC